MLFTDSDDILKYNLFVYCYNNPAIFTDADGKSAAVSTAIAGGLSLGGPVGWAVLGGTALGIIAVSSIPWDNITSSLIKSDSKTKSKIKNERNKYNYWKATYRSYKNGTATYFPSIPLSYHDAISFVRGGGSVFADSRNNAYKLASAVGGGRPSRDVAHGTLGYWKHYHATRGGKRIGGHVFYV